jgi:HAD superfamily hydrolase (TIGR01662 family)
VQGSPRLYILDLDGTLVTTRSGNGDRIRVGDRPPEADWRWIRDGATSRLEKIRQLRRDDPEARFAIATNQGGVAYGFHDRTAMEREIATVALALGPDVFWVAAFGMREGSVPGLHVLPQYNYDDPLRKPAPGALEAAMRHFDIPPERTLMVGDSPDDREAARAAGCDFRWAEEFFVGLEAPAREMLA